MTQFQERGQTDDRLIALGGVIQQDRRNVCFREGEEYDRAAELLKLPALPKRKWHSSDEWLHIHGPRLWSELHRWALTAEIDGAVARIKLGAWLIGFAKRIPCGKCRQHWKSFLTKFPPLLSDRDALFAWTVSIHNDVNKTLGKPTISVDQARKIHQHRKD